MSERTNTNNGNRVREENSANVRNGRIKVVYGGEVRRIGEH